MFTLIPKIFYADRDVGLDLFVNGLGFEVLYQDDTLSVIEREGAKATLVESAEHAARDRPELAIETDRVEAIWADIAKRRPDLLHPNVPRPAKRPWGPTEFGLLDRTGVCIVFRQW
jgi:hypothetical protein